MGAFRETSGSNEAQPLEGAGMSIRPRSRLSRAGYAREETASAPIILAEPAGGWIRMPVRAPVTDPDLCVSAQADGETSDAKFVMPISIGVMATHR